MIRRAEARSPKIATGEERSAESRERRNRPDEWKLFTEQRSATRLDIRRAEARSPKIATGEERSAESRERRNRPDEWKLFTEQRSATRLDIIRIIVVMGDATPAKPS